MELNIDICTANKDDLPAMEAAFFNERFKFKQDRTGLKLRDSEWKILLAKHQGNVVGILTAKNSERYDWVRHIDVIQVVEAFRRNGIARKLILVFESKIQKEWKRLIVEAQVDPPNGPSKPLLEKLGYQYNPLDSCYQKRIVLTDD